VRRIEQVVSDVWSVWPLVLPAILLLALGAIVWNGSAGAALVGAGAALAGAAATRVVDVGAARRRDLDETRRLAYLAQITAGKGSYELAATLANALAHHQRTTQVKVAMQRLTALAKGEDLVESNKWLDKQVERITKELGDAPDPIEPPDDSHASTLSSGGGTN
jgi:hypothetical protein